MNDVFVHASAVCETKDIGPGTRIWAFAHVLAGARIGSNCNISDGVFIENDVVVGDRVTVKCGVQLWDGVGLEDDVFVGPNVTFASDALPRNKTRPTARLRTTIRRGVSIGANATIMPGIEVGSGAMIGAGAVVINTVPPNAIVAGNPARISGYVQEVRTADEAECLPSGPVVQARGLSPSVTALGVGGSTLHQMRFVEDMRGNLSVGEYQRDIPFTPKRYFLVFDVPTPELRGEHAHRICHQFLVCVRGSCRVLLDDTTHRREITLDRPDLGLYIPPMIWGTQHNYSPDAMLLVFASEYYDPDEYIRDHDEFCALTASRPV